MTASRPVQRAATRHRIRLASGVLWERLTTHSEPGIEFLHVTYELGGASSPRDAYQRHAGHEWGYVLSGRLQVRIGFEEYILEPGDAISINSAIPHRLATIGDEPVEAIWFVLGRAPVRCPDAHRRAPGRDRACPQGVGRLLARLAQAAGDAGRGRDDLFGDVRLGAAGTGTDTTARAGGRPRRPRPKHPRPAPRPSRSPGRTPRAPRCSRRDGSPASARRRCVGGRPASVSVNRSIGRPR